MLGLANRFDCLGRRILVAKGAAVSDAAVDDSEQEDEASGGVQVIPGILRFYNTSTRLFGIRYPHGNRCVSWSGRILSSWIFRLYVTLHKHTRRKSEPSATCAT